MVLKKKYFFLFLIPFFSSAQLKKQYFQQEVNYQITVSLDDVNHFLFANEKIEYINNSLDSISFIYFHLWPNAYKNTSTALANQQKENGKLIMHFAHQKELGWIDSLDFKINSQKVKWELDPENIDIAKITLNTCLPPGQKIEITTPFRVKIPSALISRLGHIDQAYAITQWYPKPAVYDINGWNKMPYLDQGEFYSEFGSFDVAITLPQNYVVGATGDIVDGDLETEWMNQKFNQTLQKIKNRKKLIDVKNSVIYDSLFFPPSSSKLKTIRFMQKNVHDFAWFADKRFNVLKEEVMLPNTKRLVKCWALFTDNNFDLWKNATHYISDATFLYSLWNGDYEYNHVTAVDGTISAGGGMEYPNITIIGEASSAFELEEVIMHEVGHNWFYGMLGSNERQHAWMDEGINSFNELRYIRTKYPEKTLATFLGGDSTKKIFGINRFKISYQYYLGYLKFALENKDQQIEQNSALFTEANYGTMVYGKTALLFDYLFHVLGEERFDEAMRFYFKNYRFKHPYPSDLRNTLEFFSAKNLSWFFDDMLSSTKKLDYKIKKYQKMDEGSHEVLVKNTGQVNGPIQICGIKNGKLIGIVWYDGFEGEKWLGFPVSEVDKIVIDYLMVMPEDQRQNNTISTSGLFKKMEPLQIKMLGMLPDPRKTQIWITPVVGYNSNNGLLLGAHLHNNLVFEKKLEYDVIPTLGLKNKQIAGFAHFQINHHPANYFIHTINAGVNLKHFSYEESPVSLNYSRVENYFNFEFRKKNLRSNVSNKLSFHFINLYIEKINPNYILPTIIKTKIVTQKTFYELRFSHVSNQKLNPYSIKFTLQAGDSANILRIKNPLVKAWIEINYHFTISENNNGFDFRLFAGNIFSRPANADYRFRMAGINGYQDYTYQYLYIERSQVNGINNQIFTEADGAFKTRMFLGQSSKYLVALNIKSPRLKKVVGLFADLATCGKDGLLNQNLLVDFGINIDLGKDIFNIYIPIAYSSDIKLGITANNWNFFQRIRINLRIDKLNPKKIINNLVVL